jgi:hypothetical protein
MSSIYDAIAVMHKEIATKQNEIILKQKEIESLTKLVEKYPDLEKQVGRWNKVAYSSKTVNGLVNRFDLRHNCGCCNDSPVEVWPYLETEHGNVYSNPSKFVVGEKGYYGGDVPYKNWEKELQNAGIPDVIIGAIKMHFKKEKESMIESLEGDYHDVD